MGGTRRACALASDSTNLTVACCSGRSHPSFRCLSPIGAGSASGKEQSASLSLTSYGDDSDFEPVSWGCSEGNPWAEGAAGGVTKKRANENCVFQTGSSCPRDRSITE